jgi:hypothetical protein
MSSEDDIIDLETSRTQAKLQWLQNSSQMNGFNLYNISREDSGHFRKKERPVAARV